MTSPLIKRVSAFELDPNKPLTASEQLSSFERRLIRLWQLRKRPSEIASFLDISINLMSDELDRLSNRLDLSYPFYEEIEVDGSTTYISKAKKKLIQEDLRWLYSLNFPTSELDKANFVSIRLCSLTHQVRELDLNLDEAKKHNSSERNALLINDYKEMISNGEKGVITKLSKKYDISRKMVDLILGEEKIVVVKKQSKIDPAITERRKKVFDEWNKNIDSSPSKRSLAIRLANKYGYSTAGIYKVIKDLSKDL